MNLATASSHKELIERIEANLKLPDNVFLRKAAISLQEAAYAYSQAYKQLFGKANEAADIHVLSDNNVPVLIDRFNDLGATYRALDFRATVAEVMGFATPEDIARARDYVSYADTMLYQKVDRGNGGLVLRSPDPTLFLPGPRTVGDSSLVGWLVRRFFPSATQYRM